MQQIGQNFGEDSGAPSAPGERPTSTGFAATPAQARELIAQHKADSAYMGRRQSGGMDSPEFKEMMRLEEIAASEGAA